MEAAALVSLFLTALVAGGWMAAMTVFVAGYKRMSPATYIEATQINTKLACKYFAPAVIIAAISCLVFMVTHGDSSSLSFRMSLASAILLLGTGIFVKVKILPINALIDKWSPTAPPENWQAIRTKWSHYHTVRTVLGVIAFILQASAVIWM